MIRIAVVDDDRLAPAGIRALLAAQPDIEVCAVHTTLAGHLAAAVEADVVLLDLLLQDGVAPARNIAALVRAGRTVLVMSVHADHREVWAAMQAGAGGYLVKDDDPDQLADAIRTVHAGAVAITPELAFVISLSPPVLSPTEHQVLLLRSRGHTYEAIAHRLNVDKSTVATLLRRAGDKFARRAADTAADTAAGPAAGAPSQPSTTSKARTASARHRIP